MHLCIDVGNTTTVMGFYFNSSLKEKITFNTEKNKTTDEIIFIISNLLKDKDINLKDVKGAIYSSVVPQINFALKSAVKQLFNLADILVISPGIKTGIPMRVDNPNEVGSDLIADLAAGKEKYSYPLLIVDLGTASKVLFIDDKGYFASAFITPGLEISLASLTSKTSLLPEISIDNKPKVLAKNTIDAMTGGTIYGHVDMLQGLCKRIEKEVNYPIKKVLCGGNAKVLKQLFDTEYIYEENFTLDGLNIIYLKNQK